jgi:hypothetical protein
VNTPRLLGIADPQQAAQQLNADFLQLQGEHQRLINILANRSVVHLSEVSDHLHWTMEAARQGQTGAIEVLQVLVQRLEEARELVAPSEEDREQQEARAKIVVPNVTARRL